MLQVADEERSLARRGYDGRDVKVVSQMDVVVWPWHVVDVKTVHDGENISQWDVRVEMPRSVDVHFDVTAIIATPRQAALLVSYLEHKSATWSHAWKMEIRYQHNYKTL